MKTPVPSAEEEATLNLVIEDWETRTRLQRALALAVLRGYDTFKKAADYLKVSESELQAANRSVWGILHDHTTGKLWIK